MQRRIRKPIKRRWEDPDLTATLIQSLGANNPDALALLQSISKLDTTAHIVGLRFLVAHGIYARSLRQKVAGIKTRPKRWHPNFMMSELDRTCAELIEGWLVKAGLPLEGKGMDSHVMRFALLVTAHLVDQE